MASDQSSIDLTPAVVADAVRVLARAGAVFSFPPESRRRSLTLEQVGAQLGFSSWWVRSHLAEFPGRWRAPGGGRNGGGWRIPQADVDRFIASRRVQR